MTLQLSNKMIVGIAVTLALLWSLTLGICYALLGFSGEFGQWVTDLLSLTPEIARWLLAAGHGLEQWGGGALIVIWGLGLAALLFCAWFARRLARWFLTARERGFA
jgi:hypothetical protein